MSRSRQKRLAQQQRGVKAKAYILTLTGAASAASPPDFGPPNIPDANRPERVVKDILRVGKWKTGFDESGRPVFWDVTPQVLSQIVADFNAMKAHGVGANLGKTHGDDNLLIHPDDLISPIDELKVAGDTLWMAAYVSPDEAKYLQNPARKVSVGVIPNHTDGSGHSYKLYLTHVAVTDRPVVAGQGPFMALADAGGGTMNPELLDAINMLMESAGLSKLGDVADEADLVSQLKGVAAALGKSAPAPTEPPAPEGGDLGGMDMSNLPPALADYLKKQNQQVQSLSDQLKAATQARLDDAKKAFSAKAQELLTGGVTKAIVDGKVALADRLGCYDLALLDGLATTLNTGGNSQGKKLADGAAPKVPGAAPSDEERRMAIAQDIADRRGLKLEDALKFVPA